MKDFNSIATHQGRYSLQSGQEITDRYRAGERGQAQSPVAREPEQYEMYRISDGRTVVGPEGNVMRFYADSLEDAESRIERLAAIFNLGAPQLFAVRGVLNAPQAQQNSLPGGPSYTVVNDPRDAAQGGIIDVAGEQPGQPGGSTPPELN